LPVREFSEGRFVVMTTKLGYIKKTDLMAFSSPRPSGLIALTIDEGDTLINVGLTDGSREIIIATRRGMAIRFPENQVREMGRNARGVRAIHLKKEGDAVVGMVIIGDDAAELLTVCDKGYGKRTTIGEYRLQSRGGSGTINCKITDRNGPVAGVCGISPDDQVMLVTDHGMMIRLRAKQISQISRATQGVRLIALADGEAVASAARIAEREDEDESDTAVSAPLETVGDEAPSPEDEDDSVTSNDD
jgi:DNA gyrase subunit A